MISLAGRAVQFRGFNRGVADWVDRDAFQECVEKGICAGWHCRGHYLLLALAAWLHNQPGEGLVSCLQAEARRRTSVRVMMLVGLPSPSTT